MRILSIDNFVTKLLDKLLSDLYIGVHLKCSTKFISKVINRQITPTDCKQHTFLALLTPGLNAMMNYTVNNGAK